MLGQPAGHLDEDPVAGAVAERVVDDLEVVEVEEQDGRARPAALAAGEGALDVVAEQDPVRQAGQRIVERVVAELRLEDLAVGRVDEQALRDGPSADRLLGHRERLVADPHLAAVAGDHPVLRPQGQAGLPVLDVGGDRLAPVVGVDEARPQLRVGHELVRPIAEDPADLGAHVGQPATVRHGVVGHVDVDRGRHVLDEDPVARIGLGELEPGTLQRQTIVPRGRLDFGPLTHEAELHQAGGDDGRDRQEVDDVEHVELGPAHPPRTEQERADRQDQHGQPADGERESSGPVHRRRLPARAGASPPPNWTPDE